jgi:hypothetical protein
MILRGVEAPDTIETDVAIIGAGAAGLAMADAFDRAGRDHVLVESGSHGLDWDRQADFFPLVTGAAMETDYLCMRTFGGATAFWSGRCAPLDPEDFTARDWVAPGGWPRRCSASLRIGTLLPTHSSACRGGLPAMRFCARSSGISRRRAANGSPTSANVPGRSLRAPGSAASLSRRIVPLWSAAGPARSATLWFGTVQGASSGWWPAGSCSRRGAWKPCGCSSRPRARSRTCSDRWRRTWAWASCSMFASRPERSRPISGPRRHCRGCSIGSAGRAARSTRPASPPIQDGADRPGSATSRGCCAIPGAARRWAG